VRFLNRLPLRIRLTVAFAGAAAVLLAGIGTFIVLRVKAGLDGQLDHALRLRAGELAEASEDLAHARAIIDAAGQPAQVLRSDGSVLVSERVKGVKPLIGPVHLAAARRGEVSFEVRERTRILARPAGPGKLVAVAASMRQREQTVETLRGVLLVGLPIVLLLASAAGGRRGGARAGGAHAPSRGGDFRRDVGRAVAAPAGGGRAAPAGGDAQRHARPARRRGAQRAGVPLDREP
jgi:hypothetical protein